jgi:uncharacterized protein YjdB
MKRLLILAAVLAGTACTDHHPTGVTPPATVRMQPDSLTLPAIGRTSQLLVEARDARAALIPTPPLTWASSAPAVASVDQTGKVTALAEGDAVITALYAGLALPATSLVRVRATVAFTARLRAIQNRTDTTAAGASVSFVVRARP